MSKSTHLILKKLVLNNFHLIVALWDKIQKSLFQEEVLTEVLISYVLEDLKTF